jgi:hypothetical protein
MSISALEASQRGNTQHDRTLAAEYKARVERAETDKASANANNYQTLTREEKRAAETNSKNQPPTGEYVKATRYASPIRKQTTKKGGKTRKHRGSRKNKKSRRR